VSVAFSSQAFRIIRNWNEQYNIGLSQIRKNKQQQACIFKKTIKVIYFKMKQSRNYDHFISKMKHFNYFKD
jgi:catabolite regulation protein CreA